MAAWPFLTRPGLPRDTDAELHVFRAAQLGEALRGGASYVRWAPDLWYGYGYPIFNYYSPLSYYLANLLTLVGGGIVTAVKAVFVLGLLGAAAGMYVFVRDNWGERAGIIAAAAYIFSPYLLFIDPHMRGNLAECWALTLFPWLLWTLQIAPSQSAIYNLKSLIGIVLWAALILTHALMALILSAILVAWLLWQLFVIPLTPDIRQSPYLEGSTFDIRHSTFDIRHSSFDIRHSTFVIRHLIFVLGLSAVYWLPFVLERGAVRLSVVGPGHFDFHNHFVAWRDLIAASPVLDLGATAPKYIRNLGLAQWLLALLAVPVVLRFRREPQARLLLFFVLCSLFLIFMMLSPSAFVWEHIPLMSFIQFPWRLLGPAAATLAICATAGFLPLTSDFRLPTSNKWVGEGIAVVMLAAVLMLALPTMYPPAWNADFGPTTPRAILQVELDGRWLGTTSTGDFVPATAKSDPPPNADLIASYDRGAVDKFDHGALPQDASVSVVEHGSTRDRFAVTSPEPFVARVLTFDFPGWRATVDDQPAPITPSDPHGLITFPVPAGTHDVRVEFGSTPPRTIGTVISVATLLVLVWLARGKRREAGSKRQEANPISNLQSPISNLKEQWIPLVVVVAFALVKVGYVDRCETCFRVTSPPGQALVAQYKIDPQVTPSDLAHVITLLGFDLPRLSAGCCAQMRAGESFPLTLYWKATAPVPKNYQVFVHLGRSGQKPLGQPLHDKLNPGDFPTTRWPLDKYVRDDYATQDSVIRVRPDAPAGEYEIMVGLYTLADGIRAPVFDSAGRPTGDSVILPIKVRILPSK